MAPPKLPKSTRVPERTQRAALHACGTQRRSSAPRKELTEVLLLLILVLVSGCDRDLTTPGHADSAPSDTTSFQGTSYSPLGLAEAVTGSAEGGVVDSVTTDQAISGGSDQLYLVQVNIHKDEIVSVARVAS